MRNTVMKVIHYHGEVIRQFLNQEGLVTTIIDSDNLNGWSYISVDRAKRVIDGEANALRMKIHLIEEERKCTPIR